MPNYRAPGISASAGGIGRGGNNAPPAYYSGRANHVPTAYFGAPRVTPGGGGSGSQPQVLALASEVANSLRHRSS